VAQQPLIVAGTDTQHAATAATVLRGKAAAAPVPWIEPRRIETLAAGARDRSGVEYDRAVVRRLHFRFASCRYHVSFKG